MNLELYTKSKENIINTLNGDMNDMDYILSLVNSLKVDFKDIEIHKYGKDVIMESTKDKLHLYTNAELKLPNYNQQDKTDRYIMIYNNKMYSLIYENVCLENEIVMQEEYIQDLKNSYEPYIDTFSTGNYELSDSDIDEYRLMEKIQEDDENYKFMQKLEKQESLIKSQKKYSTKDYSIISFEPIPLEQYILSNYGLFEPLSYSLDYISPLKDDEIIDLNSILKDVNLEKEYYFSENVGLVTGYLKKEDLKTIGYHVYEYFDVVICGEYIVLCNLVKSISKLNNIEEAISYIKNDSEQIYDKIIEEDRNNKENYEDKIPF